MIDALAESPASMLVQRLQRGADLLFDMEQRGDFGDEYERFLNHFVRLLGEYEESFTA